MTGIILVNMGGPLSEEDMKFFLLNMFNDKRIIGAPKLIRKAIANKITKSRYKDSWGKYMEIGGTPIIENTKLTAEFLQTQVSEEYIVDYAFSYSKPQISDTVDKLVKKGIHQIRIIPLYPQASFTTTSSVADDIEKILKKNKNLDISMSMDFCDNSNFIDFWVEQVQNHIKENNLKNPLLVYSAHSIPKYLVAKGDTYPDSIEKSAKLISDKCSLKYNVCYQSKIGKLEWVGPDTKEFLSNMKDVEEVVLVPVSFVSENLETKYDLDTEIIPFVKNIGNFAHVSRLKIPVTHPLMNKAIMDNIKDKY